jgi:hypothetical protein
LTLYRTKWPPPGHRYLIHTWNMLGTIHNTILDISPLFSFTAIALFTSYSINSVLAALNYNNLYLINHSYLRDESGDIGCVSPFSTWCCKSLFLNMNNSIVIQLLLTFHPILIKLIVITRPPGHPNIFKRCASCHSIIHSVLILSTPITTLAIDWFTR